MTVQFMVRCDRGGAPRDKVEEKLRPTKNALTQEGIITGKVINVAATIVCSATKDVFEKVFATRLQKSSSLAPNTNANWVAEPATTIPDTLKQAGVVGVDICS